VNAVEEKAGGVGVSEVARFLPLFALLTRVVPHINLRAVVEKHRGDFDMAMRNGFEKCGVPSVVLSIELRTMDEEVLYDANHLVPNSEMEGGGA